MNVKTICAAMAVYAIAIGGADAADIVAEETIIAPAPAPAASWDGVFIGLHTGYGWTDSTVSRTATGPGPAFSFTQDMDGLLGGIQVGYNYQHNNLVFGAIADIALTGMSETGVFAGASTITFKTEYNYIATVRGRVGWLWNDVALLYAHGGLAITDLATDFTSTGLGPVHGMTIGGMETGWVAGAGVETALSDRVTFFAAYSYMDFGGSQSQAMPSGRVYTVDNDPINAVKIGFNISLWQPQNW